MASDSVTQLILFVVAVGVSALVVGSVISATGLYAHSATQASERDAAEIATAIEIVNDPEAGVYDANTGTVTLYVKNVGERRLEPDGLDVLLNGTYVEPASVTVLADDYWREGRTLEVTIDAALAEGTHRGAVRLNGVVDVLEFEVGTSESEP